MSAPAADSRVCCVPDCGRPCASTSDPLCHGHRSRKRRGLDLSAPLRPRRQSLAQRLVDASHAYFMAETEEEFTRAKARFRMVLRDARLEGIRVGQRMKTHEQQETATAEVARDSDAEGIKARGA